MTSLEDTGTKQEKSTIKQEEKKHDENIQNDQKSTDQKSMGTEHMKDMSSRQYYKVKRMKRKEMWYQDYYPRGCLEDPKENIKERSLEEEENRGEETPETEIFPEKMSSRQWDMIKEEERLLFIEDIKDTIRFKNRKIFMEDMEEMLDDLEEKEDIR